MTTTMPCVVQCLVRLPSAIFSDCMTATADIVERYIHKQERPKDVILALCRPTVSLARKDQDVVEKDLNALLLLMSKQNLSDERRPAALWRT